MSITVLFTNAHKSGRVVVKKKKKDDRVVITACVLKGNIIFILATAY